MLCVPFEVAYNTGAQIHANTEAQIHTQVHTGTHRATQKHSYIKPTPLCATFYLSFINAAKKGFRTAATHDEFTLLLLMNFQGS